MELKLKRLGDIYIVSAHGEIDLFHSRKLRAVFDKFTSENVSKLIVNLDDVSYIDSSGVGALLYMFSEGKKRLMKMHFARVHGPVKKVIELTKLTNYLPIVDTVEEGIEKIKNGE
jgi:anti-sigma B factor antagonist